MMCFVLKVIKKMGAKMSCKMSVLLPSEMAWSLRYYVFCARDKQKDARRNVLQNE